MAAAYQAESHATAFATTTVVTKPTGTVDGDLVIVGLFRNGTDEVNSVPSGWTLLQADNGTNTNMLRVYWKLASSEGADWTWGWDGASSNKAWVALRFDNVDPAAPINASAIAQVGNDGTPSWANTITPSRTDCMLLMIINAVQNASQGTSAYAIATSSPTWTERTDVDLGSNSTLATATGVRPEVTATGNSSATLGTDDTTEDSVCCIVAINRPILFTASLSDTVTVSDSVTPVADYTVALSDTVTVTDDIEATKARAWATQDKSATTWTNQDKS